MRGRSSREPRLDPVRWRLPGRGALLRLAVVAALLATAAVVLWSRPQTCAEAPTAGCVSDPAADGGHSAADPPGPPKPSQINPVGTDLASIQARAAVPSGTVGVPIRLAEPTALQLIRAGDHVDLFRLNDADEAPQPIATAALVLGVTGPEDPITGGLLLALTPAEAQQTVTKADHGYAILIRPDG